MFLPHASRLSGLLLDTAQVSVQDVNIVMEIAMDGTFAVLTFFLGMFDAYSDCKTGCLAKNEVQPRLSVSHGSLQFKGNDIGSETYIRYDTKHANGPYQTIVGASYSNLGDVWVGVGHSYTLALEDSGFFAEVHAMTGVYHHSGGPDLGGPIEFRSGAELGYRWDSGWRLGASYDHRSNAELFAQNPGVETVQIRLSVPIK